jgi:hypothetical protein
MSDIDIGTFNPDQAKRVWESTKWVERQGSTRPQGLDRPTPAGIYFRNDSGHTVPGYGCVQVTGTVEIGGQNYFTVVRPISWTAAVVGPFLFNGPNEVLDGELGTAQNGPVYRAINSTDDTLAVGMRIGPATSSFEMRKGCLYSYLGADAVIDDCIKLISNETPIIAVAGSGIAANGSGTVTKKDPSSGDWVAGTETYTARNLSATAITVGANVKCFPVDAKWSAVEIC